MHLPIFKKKKKKKKKTLFNFNMSNLLTCYLVMFAYAKLKLFDERQQSSDSSGNVNC